MDSAPISSVTSSVHASLLEASCPQKNCPSSGAEICVLATEASGDMLGHHLIHALRARWPHVRICGIGGPLMTTAGEFESWVPWDHFGHMGLVTILRHLPGWWRIFRETVRHIVVRDTLAGLVTIDSPEFCLRIGRAVHRQRPHLPRIHCVAPSVWAWRRKRAWTTVPASTDHLLTLFPFESQYFEHMPHTFVGHPFYNDPPTRTPGALEKRLSALGMGSGQTQNPVLCLLPGSRRKEIHTLLPMFLQTNLRLTQSLPTLRCAIALTPASWDQVCAILHQHGYQVNTPPGISDTANTCTAVFQYSQDPHHSLMVTTCAQDKALLMGGSVLALAASGTVTLELAHAGLPMITAYRVHALEAWFLRRCMHTRWVSLPNIIAHHMGWSSTPAIPEFLQDDLTIDALTQAAFHLLTDADARKAQTDMFANLHSVFTCQGPFGQACATAIQHVLGAGPAGRKSSA